MGNLRARHGETPQIWAQKGLPEGPIWAPLGGPLEAKSPETQLKPGQYGLRTGAQGLRARIWGLRAWDRAIPWEPIWAFTGFR